MPSRMDRYNTQKISKRIEKNQELYENLKDYSEIKEVPIEPIIKKSTSSLSDIEERPVSRTRKKYDSFEKIISENEKKDYDINNAINRARENRTVKDELEEKRKLKKEEYNITSQVDINNLEKHKKVEDVLTSEEKENVKEMINTIYSNKLREEIDKAENTRKIENTDLFSDLMPSDSDETIISDKMAEKIIKEERELEKEIEIKEETEELKNLDKSFFTKSMNLNKKDLEEFDTSFVDDKSSSKALKIIIVLIIAIILAFILYFIYKSL